MSRYNIRPESDIPIYRQLADQINAEIRSGVLKTGTQLPTVREMADKMHLSCGTVKRVYDRLREMGVIDMTRRRGSFVSYTPVSPDSRKARAMHSIDRMFRELSELRFSPQEINIFLNLKMREWGLRWSGIHVCVIRESEETGFDFHEHISGFADVHGSFCELTRALEYPYTLDEQFDLLLIDHRDADTLLPLLPDKEKAVRIACALPKEQLIALARLEGRCCVLSRENIFPEAVSRACGLAFDSVPFKEDMPPELLSGYEHIIVPASLAGHQRLAAYSGRLLPLKFAPDEGSMLAVRERIEHLRSEKQLRPVQPAGEAGA